MNPRFFNQLLRFLLNHSKRTGIFLLGLVLLSPFLGLSQNGDRIKTVVIDAGHGGKDPGAIGKKSYEKDIALAIALKTGHYISENFTDVEVVYTRDEDVFIGLDERAQIANKAGADVFISLHCNSNASSRPTGAETFVLGLHRTQDNLEVAKTENAAIFYEDDYEEQYEGFNPNNDEDYIVLTMFQSANIDQSISLASEIQDQFEKRVGRKNRGVKQAGFLVLRKTTMTGILVELGFISNPDEEKFLLSEDGQVYMASAIYRAFKNFKNTYEANNITPIIDIPEPSPKDTIYFRIQFASFKKEKSVSSKKFKGLEDIRYFEQNGLFKYTSGNTTSFEEAGRIKEKVREQGYHDAFIIALRNNEIIPVSEALKETKP